MRTRPPLHLDAIREYAAGSLWVAPAAAGLIALVAGALLSQVRAPRGSPLTLLEFQGTADDARTLLITIAGTVVTVIALVLGLTVVALQLSSTQFSPRLLRNFLRDRATQQVMSVFLGTFVYSAAGLYTVGIAAGVRTQDYPRLAVTGSLVLLFATLGMVVYYADHLAHSLQIDAITGLVQRNTLVVVEHKPGDVEDPTPVPPPWAVAVPARRSGYVETAHPERLLAVALEQGVQILLRPRVGEHVVGGTPLAWMWRPTPEERPPDPAAVAAAFRDAVRIGFERTLEQDIAFGIRQLVDIAARAVSRAVDDSYTAVQAIEHIAVVFCAMAQRPLGDDVARDAEGRAVVTVPSRRFADYLATMCGLIRRYGSHEPTVSIALLRLLTDVQRFVLDDPVRLAAVRQEAHLVLADAERRVGQPADLVPIRAAAAALGVDASGHPLGTYGVRPDAGAAEELHPRHVLVVHDEDSEDPDATG